jgi:hypothetical protein
MILEAVPALPDKRRNGHQVIKRASRHYAEALRLALGVDTFDLDVTYRRPILPWWARNC